MMFFLLSELYLDTNRVIFLRRFKGRGMHFTKKSCFWEKLHVEIIYAVRPIKFQVPIQFYVQFHYQPFFDCPDIIEK